MTIKTSALAAAALAAGIAVASAQPAPAQDPHHPGTDGVGTAQTQPATPPARQPSTAGGLAQPGATPMQQGAPGMMMGGDMAQMMTMMQMMQRGMLPMGMGPRGGDPFRHVEGQIAFYKAELKITDAQAAQWNAFADVLGASSGRLRQAMMNARQAPRAVAAPEQMERRIAMLTELRDTMQAVLAAAKPLYASLSDEQKKIADELMAEHMMSMHARGM